MYKNQLQELAQRSCFNLPSYTCIREGPDHAPRFKATVNFNGEIFESPHYCSTLRQAEHSAAEVALNSLSHRGPSPSLAARILVSYLMLALFFFGPSWLLKLSKNLNFFLDKIESLVMIKWVIFRPPVGCLIKDEIALGLCLRLRKWVWFFHYSDDN